MSHVATIDIEVKDLDALGDACRRIGLELIRGQTTYKWWGRHMGDFPIPDGFDVEDLGKCEHAIRVTDRAEVPAECRCYTHQAYEIGVVRRCDGRPGYSLLWDFIDPVLVAAVGEDCGKLKQAYGTTVATKQARLQGFTVQERQQADGSVRLVLSK